MSVSAPQPAQPLNGALQSPVLFLSAINFVNWIGYASWSAMINNFAKESGGFGGAEIGLMQSIREIPGFLAFTAVFLFLFLREQTLAYVSLLVLALGIALTGFFPTLWGIVLTTFVMSVGFHYLETSNQSLSLQLLPKAHAPRLLGKIAGVGAAAQMLAYAGVALAWWLFTPSYQAMYLASGFLALMLTVLVILLFPRFQGTVPQTKGIVLRSRYWLYYALTFLSGARRQIFMAFGGFLLVEKFGFSVSQIAMLLIVTTALSTVASPRLGALIGSIGERATIIMENVVLIAVFIGYAFAGSATLVSLLFILDGVFFTLVIAQRTYFQKIADPEHIAPTAAVAFTINHIAAVFLPVTFGVLWTKIAPAVVFEIGAAIACVSLALAFLVPRHPSKGHETTFKPRLNAAPAE